VNAAGGTVSFSATDSGSGVETLAATYTLNGATPVEITSGTPLTVPGVYYLTVTATDRAGNFATTTIMFVVYDPNGGFVTGGGWINSPAGSCKLNDGCLTLSGKATFGFVSKYQKGAKVPTGNTEFQFQAGNLNFKASSYEWLVVSGSKAQYKGTGTINGQGNYGFLLTATDGGNKGADKFRIKIWDKNNGDTVVYDNATGSPDDLDTATPQELGGGGIVIHTK
jgi:hypothetical protein